MLRLLFAESSIRSKVSYRILRFKCYPWKTLRIFEGEGFSENIGAKGKVWKKTRLGRGFYALA